MQWKTNRKSYMMYRIAPLPKTLSDLKSHFVLWNFSNYRASEMWHASPTVCLHMNLKANTACNFNCLVETEGLLKVTGSQSTVNALFVYSICPSLSHMVVDRSFIHCCPSVCRLQLVSCNFQMSASAVSLWHLSFYYLCFAEYRYYIYQKYPTFLHCKYYVLWCVRLLDAKSF